MFGISRICMLLAVGMTFLFGIQPASAAITGAAAWVFDDVSGTSVPDATGNGNTATLVNGATTSTNTPFAYSGNLSMSLDGTDDYMNMPDPLTNFTVDATMEVWVNPASLGAENWVWRVGRSGSVTYYALRLVSGKVHAFFGNKTGTAISGATLSTNAWTHLAATYSTTDGVKIFINGVQDGSATWNDTSGIGNASGGLLGTENGFANFFHGLMDEFRISEGVLSDEQILFDATHSLVPEPASLALLGLGGLLLLRPRQKV